MFLLSYKNLHYELQRSRPLVLFFFFQCHPYPPTPPPPPLPPLKEKIIKIKTLLTPQVVKGSMSALVEKLKTERKEVEGNSGLKETLSRLFYN